MTTPRFAALVLGLLLFASGCSALHGTVNPAAMWSISEPAPMSVVIERGHTATEVSGMTAKLLRTAPAEESSATVLVMQPAEAREHLVSCAAPLRHVSAQARLVKTNAWARKLGGLCLEERPDDGVIASLGEEAAKAFEDVDARVLSIAEKKADVASSRKSLRKAKNDEKAALKARITQLKAELRTESAELKPREKQLFARIESASSQIDPEVRPHVSGLAFNLLAAVKAESANSAAIVKYPFALPKLTDDLQATIKRIVAEIIEEQTGELPDLSAMKIDLKLEDKQVKLKLAGIDAGAIGRLDPVGLVKEATRRTQAYVVQVFTRPKELNATAERLRFQHRVLAALTKNLAPPATGVTNLGKLKVTTTEAKSAAAQAEGDKDDDTGDGGDGDAKESPEGIACSSGEVFAPPV